MKLWIVVQVKTFDDEGWALDWDFAGAFTTEAKARDVCTQPGDCMWPVEADTFLGRETLPPPGRVFPHGDGS